MSLNEFELYCCITESGRVGEEDPGSCRALTHTCRHEAKHATVLLYLGLKATIRIDPTGGITNHADDGVFRSGSAEDLDSDEKITSKVMAKSPLPVDLEAVRRECARILKMHESFVETVAASLESRVTWDADGSHALLTQSELAAMWFFHKRDREGSSCLD